MTVPRGQHRDEYEPALLADVLSTLERVLRCFGAAREHVTIIGGLAPALLVPNPVGEAHVGTSDLDLCMTIALAEGATGYYDEVAPALRAAGFQQVRDHRRRFRWYRAAVVVDFLYPAAEGEPPLWTTRSGQDWEEPAMASLGEDFAALAVGYPRLLHATRQRARFQTTLDGALVPDAWVYVSGPGALAALKADALGPSGRLKPKDSYDIVWVLDQVGPEQAAAQTLALLAGQDGALAELRTATGRLEDVFAEGRAGPVWYATFTLGAGAGPDQRAIAERFAHETVAAFLAPLRRHLG